MRSIGWTAVLALGMVGGVTRLPAQQRDSTTSLAGTGWLGVGLSCSDCSLQRARGRGRDADRAWTFHSYPALTWLDNDGPAYHAGLRAGDTITAIDGHDLLTEDGGRAFAMIAPDQNVQLSYRRDGRTQRARLTVGTSPEQRAVAAQMARIRVLTDSARAVAAAHADEIRQAQREMIRAQQEMGRLQSQLARAQRLRLDTMQQLQRAQLDSARQRVEEAQRELSRVMSRAGAGYGYGFGYSRAGKCFPGTPGCYNYSYNWTSPTPSVAPMPAMPPDVPNVVVTPNVNVAPFVWGSGDAVRSISSADYAGFGRLRYSGRLGANIIEARAPGPINAVEEGDSVIIITSGDMSVRVQLRQTAPAPARGR